MHNYVAKFFSNFFAIAYCVFCNIKTRLTSAVENTFVLAFTSSSMQKKTGFAERLQSLAKTSLMIRPTTFADFSLSIWNDYWERSSEVTIIFNNEDSALESVPNSMTFITIDDNSKRKIIDCGRHQIYIEDDVVAVICVRPERKAVKKLILQLTKGRSIVSCRLTKISIFVNNHVNFNYDNVVTSSCLEHLSVFGPITSFSEKQLRDLSSIILCTEPGTSQHVDLSIITKYRRHSSVNPLEKINSMVQKMVKKGTLKSPFTRAHKIFEEESSENESEDEVITISSSEESEPESID